MIIKALLRAFGVEDRSQWAECVGLDLHTVLGTQRVSIFLKKA